MLYIGIDLGTSACKLLLVDEKGCVRNTVSKEYPLCFPHPGWSEQDPGDWWTACREGVPELLAGFDAREVRGMGVGGQMHGLVALDETDAVLRPAILERRPYRRRNSLAERYGGAPGAQRAHGKHRVCRLYSAQAALDEKA